MGLPREEIPLQGRLHQGAFVGDSHPGVVPCRIARQLRATSLYSGITRYVCKWSTVVGLAPVLQPGWQTIVKCCFFPHVTISGGVGTFPPHIPEGTCPRLSTNHTTIRQQFVERPVARLEKMHEPYTLTPHAPPSTPHPSSLDSEPRLLTLL